MISIKFFKERLDDLIQHFDESSEELEKRLKEKGVNLTEEEYCDTTSCEWGIIESCVNTLLMLFYDDDRIDNEEIEYDDCGRELIYDYICGEIEFLDMLEILEEIKSQQKMSDNCDIIDIDKIERMIKKYKKEEKYKEMK